MVSNSGQQDPSYLYRSGRFSVALRHHFSSSDFYRQQVGRYLSLPDLGLNGGCASRYRQILQSLRLHVI
jgi:hypothetical protein